MWILYNYSKTAGECTYIIFLKKKKRTVYSFLRNLRVPNPQGKDIYESAINNNGSSSRKTAPQCAKIMIAHISFSLKKGQFFRP